MIRFSSTREWSIYTYLYLGSALLLLAGFIYGAFLHRSERLGADESARQAFLGECLEDRSQALCEARLEAEHQRCFRGNFHQGGRHTGTSFSQPEYLRCMRLGAEPFFQEKRRRQREREDLGRP